MTDLQIFDFKGNNVRTVMLDGEVWFVAKDILDAMGSTTTVTALKTMIDEDLGKEFVTNQPLKTVGGTQTFLMISKPAVTLFLSRSRTEFGKAMNRWLHSEVIPSIEKTGSYSVQLSPAQIILKQAQQLVDLEEQQKALEIEQNKQSKRTDELEEVVNQHDAELERVFHPDGDYYSIRGYASLLELPMNLKEANRLGRLASKRSKALGYSKDKLKDPRYGKVGAYHEFILKQIFDEEY